MVRKLTLAVIGLRLPTISSVDFGAQKDFGYGTAMFFFAKTVYGGGPASPNFDHRAWRGLNLPDDWAVELPFDPNGRGSHGFSASGRNFPQNTIANEHSGHSTFRYDLTDYLNYGGNNGIAVRVDATTEQGWFYEGAGGSPAWRSCELPLPRYGRRYRKIRGHNANPINSRTGIFLEPGSYFIRSARACHRGGLLEGARTAQHRVEGVHRRGPRQ